ERARNPRPRLLLQAHQPCDAQRADLGVVLSLRGARRADAEDRGGEDLTLEERSGTVTHLDAGWSSPVARWAHNPKVAGSNPAPATICTGMERSPVSGDLFVCWATVNIAARLPLSSIQSWLSPESRRSTQSIHVASRTPPSGCPRAEARPRAVRPSYGRGRPLRDGGAVAVR